MVIKKKVKGRSSSESGRKQTVKTKMPKFEEN
jgi:hypothetical protein